MVTVCPQGHFWLPWIPAFAGMTARHSQLVLTLALMRLRGDDGWTPQDFWCLVSKSGFTPRVAQFRIVSPRLVWNAMTDFSRYAIYWTPEPGSDLEAFGHCWFGAGPDISGLRQDLAARAKEAPARYGLHATLKAPFRLREGIAVKDLQGALDSFCAIRRAPSGGALTLAQFQGYLGLVLAAHTADIDWLAAECVTHFDCFRAPSAGSGVDWRSGEKLTAGEETFLASFGYPYVLSAFQFHVSLAGPLGGPELNEAAWALRPHLLPFMKDEMKIENLSLLGEPESGGPFEIISLHRFRWCAGSKSNRARHNH
jgi:Protein of unknown function (DUF1045)